MMTAPAAVFLGLAVAGVAQRRMTKGRRPPPPPAEADTPFAFTRMCNARGSLVTHFAPRALPRSPPRRSFYV